MVMMMMMMMMTMMIIRLSIVMMMMMAMMMMTMMVIFLSAPRTLSLAESKQRDAGCSSNAGYIESCRVRRPRSASLLTSVGADAGAHGGAAEKRRHAPAPAEP